MAKRTTMPNGGKEKVKKGLQLFHIHVTKLKTKPQNSWQNIVQQKAHQQLYYENIISEQIPS